MTSLSDDDEPREIREDPLAEPTRGTDEEDTKVGEVIKVKCVHQLFHFNQMDPTHDHTIR